MSDGILRPSILTLPTLRNSVYKGCEQKRRQRATLMESSPRWERVWLTADSTTKTLTLTARCGTTTGYSRNYQFQLKSSINLGNRMQYIKHCTPDSWAESCAGRGVLNSHNVPMVVAVILNRQLLFATDWKWTFSTHNVLSYFVTQWETNLDEKHALWPVTFGLQPQSCPNMSVPLVAAWCHLTESGGPKLWNLDLSRHLIFFFFFLQLFFLCVRSLWSVGIH